MDRNEMVTVVIGMTLAAVVLLSPAACTMHRQLRIKEAIAAGADPQAAKCAIEADTGQTAECILVATDRRKEP